MKDLYYSLRWITASVCNIHSGKRWRRLCGLCNLFSSVSYWREISTGNKLFTSNDHKNRFSARRTQNRERFSCGLAAHYSMHAHSNLNRRVDFCRWCLTFTKSGIYHVARDKCRHRFFGDIRRKSSATQTSGKMIFVHFRRNSRGHCSATLAETIFGQQKRTPNH